MMLPYPGHGPYCGPKPFPDGARESTVNINFSRKCDLLCDPSSSEPRPVHQETRCIDHLSIGDELVYRM
jgi:hypothetical protein